MPNTQARPYMNLSELMMVESPAVSCDGGGGALGHPRVYLRIKPGEKDIMCPYCSRKFVLQGSGSEAH